MNGVNSARQLPFTAMIVPSRTGLLAGNIGRVLVMTEVDKNTQTGTVQEMRPWEKYTAHKQRVAEHNAESSKGLLTANQVDKILTAETEEEIWDGDEGGMYALKDLVGMELELRSAKDLPSTDPTKQNLFGTWLLMECTALTEEKKLGIFPGDVVTINTGVETVISKISALQAKGIEPIRFRVQGTAAGQGEMVRIRPIPKRSVQAEAK